MVLGGIGQQAHVGQNDRIGPGAFGIGHGAVPQILRARRAERC